MFDYIFASILSGINFQWLPWSLNDEPIDGGKKANDSGYQFVKSKKRDFNGFGEIMDESI